MRLKNSDMFRMADFQKSAASMREPCKVLVAHGDIYHCFKESTCEWSNMRPDVWGVVALQSSINVEIS